MVRQYESDEAPRDRRSKRSLVLLSAKVRVDGKETDVRLRNLSQRGALLEGEEPPEVGTILMFERGRTRVKARVAWSKEGRFGVEFLKPIEEREVLVHVGRPRSQPDPEPLLSYGRPGLKGQRLTPAERRLAESWARPVDRRHG